MSLQTKGLTVRVSSRPGAKVALRRPCPAGTRQYFGPSRDITDKATEFFSGHLVAPDHEFGGIFARSVYLKLPEKFSRRHLLAFLVGSVSSNT